MICPICHEVFMPDKFIVLVKHTSDTSIDCSRKRGHYYHNECMRMWMDKNNCCPMDRDPVRKLYKVRYYELCALDESHHKYYKDLLHKIDITDKMLDNIINIDSLDDTGHSLAYYACQQGNHSLVTKLLKRKADFHLPDKNRFTPFMAVVSNNYYEIAKKLLTNRTVVAQVNKRDVSGRNAFDYACANNCLTIIREMLDRRLVSDRQVRQNITDYRDHFKMNKLFGNEILDIMYHYLKK